MEHRLSPKKRSPVSAGSKRGSPESRGDTPGDDVDEVRPDFDGLETDENGDPDLTQIEEYVQVHQVHGNHTLDPVTSVHDIAYMAGYGGDAWDAIDGVDLLVTGDVDAMKELEAPSATRGGPLELDDDESIFNDDTGHGDMAVLMPNEGAGTDWTSYMRLDNEETLV